VLTGRANGASGTMRNSLRALRSNTLVDRLQSVRAAALMASVSSSVRRIVSLSRSGLGQAVRTTGTTAGSCDRLKMFGAIGFCWYRAQASAWLICFR
jgi:hypothetical protein